MNLAIPLDVLEELKKLKDGQETNVPITDSEGNPISLFVRSDGGQLNISITVTKDTEPTTPMGKHTDNSINTITSEKSNESSDQPSPVKETPGFQEKRNAGKCSTPQLEMARKYPTRTRKIKSAKEMLRDKEDEEDPNKPNVLNVHIFDITDQCDQKKLENVSSSRKTKSSAGVKESPLEGDSFTAVTAPMTNDSVSSKYVKMTELSVGTIMSDGNQTHPDSTIISLLNSKRKGRANAPYRGLRNQKKTKVFRLGGEQSQTKQLFDESKCIVHTNQELETMMDSLQPQQLLEDYYIHSPNIDHPDGKPLLLCLRCPTDEPGLVFSNKKDFTKHIKTHIEFKPWHCPKCDQKYEFKGLLSRHIYTHSKIKPFQCVICTKSFIYKQKLQLHMKYHYDQKDIYCPLCEESFHERKSLYRHLERVHPEKAALVSKTGCRKSWKCITEIAERVIVADQTGQEQQNSDDGSEAFAGDDDGNDDDDVEKSAVEVPNISPMKGGKTRKSEAHPKMNNAGDIRDNETETTLNDIDDSTATPNNQSDEYQNQESVGSSLLDSTQDGGAQNVIPMKKLRHSYITATLVEDKQQHQILKCTVCGTSFINQTALLRHLFKAHEEAKPYKCHLCKYRSRYRSALFLHKKSHSEERLHQCTLCEKSFKFKCSLKSHMNNHSNLRAFKCTMCEQTFNNSYNRLQHTKRMHDYVTKDICDVCGKQFKTIRDLRRHKESHNEGRNMCCKYCDKKYKTHATLYMHMKSHTVRFYCSICEKHIYSYSSFLLHKRSHEPDFKGYPCTLCKHVFKTKGNLTHHSKVVHNDVRPFTCQICNRAFKTKSHLERHIYVHSEEKVYQCPTCDLACKRIESLQKHMKVHLEVKPYACPQCDSSYTQQAALNKHIQAKHDSSSALDMCDVCDVCFKSFNTPINLARHKRRMHPENIEPSHQQEGATFAEDDIAVAALDDNSDEQHFVNTVDDQFEDQQLVVKTGPVVCDQCETAFDSQQSLVVHVLTDHMGQKWVGGMGVAVATGGNIVAPAMSSDGTVEDVAQVVEISTGDSIPQTVTELSHGN